MDLKFNTSYGLQVDLASVADEIVAFMEKKPKASYRVTIGSDSELLEDKTADFVTAVVVHRIGNGGRYFWRRVKLGKFYNLHDRIVQEVMLSIDASNAFLNVLKTKIQVKAEGGANFNWSFEVHVDVGENGPTKTLIQEVVGMVRAHNFEPKTKPESYAASNVADIYA
ncbi:ribonuclease H-like YkuK family protein [Patescibacteria group bacterium]|nr:ribonuclease H-like YkuK family protein [Patescibacteria group bacterium]